MRDDSLDVKGFINQYGGYCDDIGKPVSERHPSSSGYNKIDWGHGSMVTPKGQVQVQNTLGSAKLGETFAAHAVRMLSSYPLPSGSGNPDMALLGLIVMVCDSARMGPVHDAIARNWNNGTELTEELKNYRQNWVEISGALLDWKVPRMASKHRARGDGNHEPTRRCTQSCPHRVQ